MITGEAVDNSVRKLYVQYGRRVSIDEVADDLNVSSLEISRFVNAHLQLGILEGDSSALAPGSAMGLM